MEHEDFGRCFICHEPMTNGSQAHRYCLQHQNDRTPLSSASPISTRPVTPLPSDEEDDNDGQHGEKRARTDDDVEYPVKEPRQAEDRLSDVE